MVKNPLKIKRKRLLPSAPEIIAEVVSKVEEPSVAGPVWIGILATALILTLIFTFIWESTP